MKIKGLFCAFLFLFSCNYIKAGEYYQATTQLNIRSGAGINYKVIGSISEGDKIFIDTMISEWGRVIIDGQPKGYVSMQYLTTDIKFNISSLVSLDTITKYWWVFSILACIIVLYIFFDTSNNSNTSSRNKIVRYQKEDLSSNEDHLDSKKENKNYSPIPKKVIMEKPNYYCENCGKKYTNVKDLLSNSCPQNPNGVYKGTHSLYQGSEKLKYFCKYCGKSYSNLFDLCNNTCTGQKGHHRPAL
jgi:uncharacterized protein YgiM (DUF1202 family)